LEASSCSTIRVFPFFFLEFGLGGCSVSLSMTFSVMVKDFPMVDEPNFFHKAPAFFFPSFFFRDEGLEICSSLSFPEPGGVLLI